MASLPNTRYGRETFCRNNNSAISLCSLLCHLFAEFMAVLRVQKRLIVFYC